MNRMDHNCYLQISSSVHNFLVHTLLCEDLNIQCVQLNFVISRYHGFASQAGSQRTVEVCTQTWA